MAFAVDKILRSGVKVIDKTLKRLQGEVTHYPYYGQDGFGKAFQVDGITLKCFIEQRLHWKEMSPGKLVEIQAILTFTKEIDISNRPDLPEIKRQEPIDPRDILVLPNGSTGPIATMDGQYDPVTKKPFALIVWLGVRRAQ